MYSAKFKPREWGCGGAVFVAALVLGCGNERIGTATKLSSLQHTLVSVSVQSTKDRHVSVYVHVKFTGVGQPLGKACPIVNAAVDIGGVRLKSGSRGGAPGCSQGIYDDKPYCDYHCDDLAWNGDITSLADGLPDSVPVVIADDSQSIASMMANPFAWADLVTPSLSDGDPIQVGESFPFTIQPVSSIDLSTLNDGDASGAVLDVKLYQLQSANNYQLATLSVTHASTTSTNEWTATLQPFSSDPITGNVRLIFSYTSKMAFSACDAPAGCSGSISAVWRQMDLRWQVNGPEPRPDALPLIIYLDADPWMKPTAHAIDSQAAFDEQDESGVSRLLGAPDGATLSGIVDAGTDAAATTS